MSSIVYKYLFAVAAAWTALTVGEAAPAQGVYIPMPGSAPAAAGPNLINPSAPAWDSRQNGTRARRLFPQAAYNSYRLSIRRGFRLSWYFRAGDFRRNAIVGELLWRVSGRFPKA
jgi:hypothetical protein